MFLRLTFASGIIEIKFIINDATRPVIRFMRMANNIHTALPIPLTGYRPNISDKEKDHINKTYNNIIQAIYALRDDLGYKWPGNVSDKFLYDQKFLNLAHRVFTNGIDFAIVNNWPEQCEHTGFTGWQSNRHDPEFDFRRLAFDKTLYDLDKFCNLTHTGQVQARQYFAEVLDIINHEVHELEQYTDTKGKLYTVNNIQTQYIQKELWLNAHDRSMSAYNGPMYYPFDTQVQYDWQKKYWQHDADVFLDGSIKGKSYLRCFMDDDDPNENDITGRKVTFGGMQLDPQQTHKKLYDSIGFEQWLKEYGLDKESINLEFPIGRIRKNTTDIWNSQGIINTKADFTLHKLEYFD